MNSEEEIRTTALKASLEFSKNHCRFPVPSGEGAIRDIIDRAKKYETYIREGN